METLETWLDGAIGETRYCIVRKGRPSVLAVYRWSDAGKRARWGEAYVGRVRSADQRLRGAFVDLGLKDEQGFLPFDAGGQVRISNDKRRAVKEGEAVLVHIVREGARGKGPVLGLLDEPPSDAPPKRVGRHDSDSDKDDAQPADAETRAKLDEAFDEALAKSVPIPNGGTLTIEPTAALTAIDVDAGGRTGGKDPEHFARQLNVDAAFEAIRQLRLRALGGIAAIDFVSMRNADGRKAVEEALKQAVSVVNDPWDVRFAPMSRFGVVELARAQYTRPLHEIFLDGEGRKTAETLALEALRAMEREAAQARGRKIIARLPKHAADWLEASHIAWREPLTARIGSRWEIEAGSDRIDVRTE